MVFKKIIFQNSLMANETPSRPPPLLHGKCHLKFPFWFSAPFPYPLLTWTYQSLTRWRTRASSNFVDRSTAMSSLGRRQDQGGRAFQDFLRSVWDKSFFKNLLSKKKVGNYFFSLQPMGSFVISDDLWLFSPPDFPRSFYFTVPPS